MVEKTDKLDRLKNELAVCEKRLMEMQKNWSESREGSRYGDEYLEVQIKVYQDMTLSIKKGILELKKSK